MNDNNFSKQQQDAIRRMKEMNAKSTYKQPEKPPEATKATTKESAPNDTSFFSSLNLPFLQNLKTDGDLTLILGILLLLLSEKADKRLLFALIYILL